MDMEELYFQSATWLRRALLTNEANPEALFLLAKLHEEGLAVDQNIERAIGYIERAANLGMTKAMTKIAHYHYSGYSDDRYRFPANKGKALDLYQRAMELGDSEASNCLGLIYEKWPIYLTSNLSFEERLIKAKECYLKAINQG